MLASDNGCWCLVGDESIVCFLLVACLVVGHDSMILSEILYAFTQRDQDDSVEESTTFSALSNIIMWEPNLGAKNFDSFDRQT